MSERLAYSIMVPIAIVGIILVFVSGQMFELINHNTTVNENMLYIGVGLMLLSSFIYLYHLYTILMETEVYNSRGQRL